MPYTQMFNQYRDPSYETQVCALTKRNASCHLLSLI